MSTILSMFSPFRGEPVKDKSESENESDTRKVEKVTLKNVKGILEILKNEDEKDKEVRKEVIRKEDFLRFEHSVNESIIALTKSIKSELEDIKKLINNIPEMIIRMDRLDNEAVENKKIIASIRGDILVQEEKHQKSETNMLTKVKKSEQKINLIFNTLGKVADKDVIMDKNLSITNDKICKLEQELKNNPTINIIENAEMEERLKKLESNLQNNNKIHKYINNDKKNNNYNKETNKRNYIGNNKNIVVNKTSKEKLIANTDNLLITTSNGKNIDTDILDYKSTCTNFTCYTFKEIIELCDNIKIEKQPRRVLIHCGNNDLDSDKDISSLKAKFKSVFAKVRKTFQEATIVISTLFPRGEEELDPTITELNRFIMEFAELDVLVMNNQSIKRRMICNDNKHLNKEGFFMFLANIRFAMFGVLPKSQPRFERKSSKKRH